MIDEIETFLNIREYYSTRSVARYIRKKRACYILHYNLQYYMRGNSIVKILRTKDRGTDLGKIKETLNKIRNRKNKQLLTTGQILDDTHVLWSDEDVNNLLKRIDYSHEIELTKHEVISLLFCATYARTCYEDLLNIASVEHEENFASVEQEASHRVESLLSAFSKEPKKEENNA